MQAIRLLSAVIVVAATFFLSGLQARAATINWTNTSGGNWSVTNNWSPHRVPTNGDFVLITTPGTYKVTVDISSSTVSSATPAITLGAGGGAAGVQTLAVPTQAFYYSNLLVTTGGVFTASSSAIGVFTTNMTTITVAGGVLNSTANTFNSSTLIVTNGGVVNSTNSTFNGVTLGPGVFNSDGDTADGFYNGTTTSSIFTVANGGVLNEAGMMIAISTTLIVTNGGVMNGLDSASDNFLNGPLLNYGTINLTNSTFIINGNGGGPGGIVNEPGGAINLRGAATLMASLGFEVVDTSYLTNRGTITETAGAGSILAFGTVDNKQGAVTNLSGTMSFGTLTNLAGTFYAGPGTTILLSGSDPVTAGTPLLLAGSGRFELVTGNLYLPSNTVPNLIINESLGSILELGPAFEGGAITNLVAEGVTISNTLPVTGPFTLTNCDVFGNFTIASGGSMTTSNCFLYGNTTVASGGRLSMNSAGSFGKVMVSAGGTLTLTGGSPISDNFVELTTVLVNAGTVNLTNCFLTVNLVTNLAGGSINLLGSTSDIEFGNYLLNQGSITQNSTTAGTNTITVTDLDTTHGTVTNFSGVLMLQGLQTNLAGIFTALPGAAIQFSGGTASAPWVAGTPAAASGQVEFTSGWLSFPTNNFPGLELLGGVLVLGPTFQGGAITNLTLAGITLTNTLPLKGTLTATNQTAFYGNLTVSNGDVFNDGATVNGTLTVANGGLMTVVGQAAVNPGGFLTVSNGGTMNIFGNIMLYGPLTNAGTINLTNSPGSPNTELSFYNDGTATYRGGAINQASGLINFGSDSTFLLGNIGGFEYLINQGKIIRSAGTNGSGLEVSCTTNSGTITTQSGRMAIFPMVTQAGGNLNVVLNSATNYSSFVLFYTGFPPNISSNMVLSGAFNATLGNGYVPTNGTVFNVFYTAFAATYSGTFGSLGLPAAVTWQTHYGSTNFTLTAGGGKPEFATFTRSGTNLIFSGTGGLPGTNYVILASTNVAIPVKNWVALITNTFDAGGTFRYTNNISPAKPRQFFIFKTP